MGFWAPTGGSKLRPRGIQTLPARTEKGLVPNDVVDAGRQFMHRGISLLEHQEPAILLKC